jgi:rhamnose utilization protein RhaD (predicted bifunctional aldolase and dehydrogenase)/NAD(P)-dependent dehydrogenase (short-subunit alcohol dehydrogenase family)
MSMQINDPNRSSATLSERVQSSRALGSDPSFVLHGGGNTSAKGVVQDMHGREVEVIWVKGSGWDLATIEAAGLPALDLAGLRALRELDDMTDEDMVREVRRCMLDPTGPTPSIETLLHAFLPQRFIDHSHADAILAVSNRADGQSICRELFGDRVVSLPWIMPGFPLAKAVADAFEAHPEAVGAMLHNHGLFTWGETADEALNLHRELVGIAADHYGQQRAAVLASTAQPTAAACDVLPTLRGAMGDAPRFVMELRDDPWILAALEHSDLASIMCTMPLTPDHSIRTKGLPMVLQPGEEIDGPLGLYHEGYQTYYKDGCAANGDRIALDANPRVILIPGLGLVTCGTTAKAASVVGDIAEHTLLTKMASTHLGPYDALAPLELFDMEYWPLEQAKLAGKTPRELEGQVAVITGGGGAIGEGVAKVLMDAGAEVALLDIDAQLVLAAAKRLGGTTLAVTADVTSEASMAEAMEAVCRRFGGIDILIPNAGIAHVASLDELEVDDLRRAIEVNQVGVFITMQTGARLMKDQGLGGSIVLVSSKNVFSPGAEFGAYSSSKAGGHQLGRIAALEYAADDIHVNMVTPDAIFSCGDNPSGLWQDVGPSRAASKGLEASELQEHYRQHNLLETTITAEDVGKAVLFFAARRTPTTGAVLPVDGGVAGAFPR